MVTFPDPDKAPLHRVIYIQCRCRTVTAFDVYDKTTEYRCSACPQTFPDWAERFKDVDRMIALDRALTKALCHDDHWLGDAFCGEEGES